MMRNRILAITAVALGVFGFATAGQAGTINATSGGASTITVSAGSTFTVDLVLTANTAGYGFELSWDGGASPVLTVANPALDNTGDIVEAAAAAVGLSFNFTVGVDNYTPSGAGTAGNINDFEAAGFVPANIVGATVGTVTFTVLGGASGSTTITPSFGTGDSLGDGLPATVGALTVNIVPEPTTASLLGLGLLGLVVAGRRRS